MQSTELEWREIPGVDKAFVVSNEGRVYNRVRHRLIRTYFNHKEYVVVSVRAEDGRALTYPLHRLVAIAFLERPERHRDKDYSELQVSHKNGNKAVNNVDNLEWLTPTENMALARASGFFDNELPVLAKPIKGKVMRYPSIAECARQHNLQIADLWRHLSSPYAGMIEADDCRYKLDNDSPWPTRWAVRDDAVRIGMACDCIGEYVESGRKLIFVSLAQAANYLSIPLTPLRLSRSRKGVDVPYQGWIFYSLSGLPLSRKLKGDRYHTLPK